MTPQMMVVTLAIRRRLRFGNHVLQLLARLLGRVRRVRHLAKMAWHLVKMARHLAKAYMARSTAFPLVRQLAKALVKCTARRKLVLLQRRRRCLK